MIPNDLGLEQAKRSEPFLVVTCEERNSSTKAEREKKLGEKRREEERKGERIYARNKGQSFIRSEPSFTETQIIHRLIQM